MSICHCPSACDCLDNDDTYVQAEWAQHDHDVNHLHAGLDRPRLEDQRPSLLVVGDPSAARTPPRAALPNAHRMARQERAARAALAPRTGNVLPFPTSPPLTKNAGETHPRPAA